MKRYGVRPSVWAFSRAAARGGFAEMGSRGRGSGPVAGDIARAAGECGQHRRKGFNISETGVEGMNPACLTVALDSNIYCDLSKRHEASRGSSATVKQDKKMNSGTRSLIMVR